MSEIILIQERHEVVMSGNNPMIDSYGNLIVRDVQENKIFAVPLCQDTREFFNLQYCKEKSPVYNNGSSVSTGVVHEDESTVSSTACWKDDNEVRCLIHLWQDHQNSFKNMKSRDVWNFICQELQKNNPEWKKKSPIQCENKWKDIKRKYMETKDHNNKSGNDPKTCKFYEDLEEILGEKPCVKPVSLASNLNRKRINANFTEQIDSEELNEDSGSSTFSEIDPQRKKKKMSRIQREMKDWSAILLADARIREEAKERRHKEVMNESRAAVEAYKQIMDKLIEKL